MNPKPEAKVLDCTAGNRKIWLIKSSPNVLWTDIEPTLEEKPDLVVDIRKTEFESKYFNMIIFDPPHYWGDTAGETFYSCTNLDNQKKFYDKYNFKRKGIPSYYGTDKYATKKSLLGFINAAQREIYRILADNGVLWLNWSEVKIPLEKILPFFDQRWETMIILPIGSKKQTLSEHQNYWIMMMKNDLKRRVN
ncbi:unnamed protein product [marine sediment metagenome]|uniref:DNA methylase N-4/N-6 domain-containing protein n=1 Tax=marine sediment metagenome TaxID=412755 RepID=X0WUR1_9ZZZZ